MYSRIRLLFIGYANPSSAIAGRCCRVAAAAVRTPLGSSSRGRFDATPITARRIQGRASSSQRRPFSHQPPRQAIEDQAQQEAESKFVAAEDFHMRLNFDMTPSLWIRRKALKYMLNVRRSTQGDLSQGVIASIKGLGLVSFEAGDIQRALSFFERALELQIELYGVEDHPEVIDTLRKLAAIHGMLGEPKQVVQMMDRLLAAVRRLADLEDDVYVAATMRDVGRSKGFIRDHFGKKTLLQNALAMQLRLSQGDEARESHSEIVKTKLYVAAAQAALGELKDVNDIVDQVLAVQGTKNMEQAEMISISLSLLYTKALIEGELHQHSEKVVLLEELEKLQLQVYGREDAPRLEVLNRLIELAHAKAKIRCFEEAKVLINRAAAIQESLPKLTPFQTVDIILRTSEIWGACGELPARVQILENIITFHEETFGSEYTEALAHATTELSEAIRLTGDRVRADELEAKSQAIRSQLEKHLGFLLNDHPRLVRIAVELEGLADRYK